jgi:hypothetical protein
MFQSLGVVVFTPLFGAGLGDLNVEFSRYTVEDTSKCGFQNQK